MTAHYQSATGLECIDAIEAALTPEQFEGFLRGNALKYLWRYDKKGSAEIDLIKARDYLTRLQNHLESQHGPTQ
jgi:hypothetical protein